VVTLKSGGVPETIPEGMAGADEIAESIRSRTLLGRAATLDDVGHVAAFVASDGPAASRRPRSTSRAAR
jgi:3-oxoacyl-[acyl-carrier protein] reductase